MTIVHNGLCATNALFRRLEDQLDRTVELVLDCHQHLCHTQTHCAVDIVAAGVHIAFVLRSEGQTRSFCDGQGVAVSADGQTFAGQFTFDERTDAVSADAGIDVGLTLIGMHLRRVAVPVRTSLDHIGEAIVLCARTRPKYIGGPRAIYQDI